MKKNIWHIVKESKYLFLIFVSIATLMISSALIELHQSKKETLQIMTKQSHSLLESIIIASQNVMRANEILDENYRQRLLNTATLIKILYDEGLLTNEKLKLIAKKNNILRINIFNKAGRRIFSSYDSGEQPHRPRYNPLKILSPILRGEMDSLIIGIKPARFGEGYRYAVAVAAKDRNIIVLNMDARELIDTRKKTGFGILMRSIAAQNPYIVYVALQDTTSLLAASGNVRRLESIHESRFLRQALKDSLFLTRITRFDTLQVFEAVHPFAFHGIKLGLFRLGLSLQPVNDINNRIYRRLIFITLLLIGLGTLIVVYIFTRERYQLLQREYTVVETYAGNIIQNVSDAIIVVNEKNGIQIFNRAAEELFSLSVDQIIGRPLESLAKNGDCKVWTANAAGMEQVTCTIHGTQKFLLVSRSQFKDSHNEMNTIYVIRDLTDQKRLEQQLQRKQRLTAMGELAAGIAHEIRNPLNTIGTIVQQLDKDFEPTANSEEYHELAGLVYNEVKRINQTIQDFLRFARPEPIQPFPFEVTELIRETELHYRPTAKEKNIDLITEIEWSGRVVWDKQQMKQVLNNLVLNAIQAMKGGGKIKIQLSRKDEHFVELSIEDNGPGIPSDIREKIFNLYFTTKSTGTGVGLSIVQRIVEEHDGSIIVESEPGKGAIFKLILPITVIK